jgi:hypothetical protein
MQHPNIDKHMQQKAKAVIESQGGTYKEAGGSTQSESFDRNRGSDTGGSNAPTKTNG